MSTGGVFKLLANDGKVDKLVLATALLQQRIYDIIYLRKRAGEHNTTPTLFDIERTHILYVNAHFKPYAAIGYEYGTVRPSSGTTTFGGTIQFSIPQFGDFFHDMALRLQIGAVYATAQATPLQSADATGAFPVSTTGTTGNRYNLVDCFGTRLVPGVVGANAATVSYRNLVRYCENPGDRILSLVKFDVSGNPLDEYDQYASVFMNKFTVCPTKRVGYNRMIGQQTELKGVGAISANRVVDADYASTFTTGYRNLGVTAQAAAGAALTTGNFNTPAGITRNSVQSNQTANLYSIQGQAGLLQPADGFITQSYAGSLLVNAGTPATNSLNAYNVATLTTNNAAGANNVVAVRSQFDIAQEVKTYCNGPQTPKPIQPVLELWIKLKFWFNDDVALAVPSVAIPYGQRFISMTVAPLASIVYEAPSIYLETITYNDDVATTLATSAAAGIQSGHQQGSILAADIAGGVVTVGTGVGTTREVRTYTELFQRAGLAVEPTLTADLYINNIFVNPEVHDIFIERIGFSLIRVFRQHREVVGTATLEKQLTSLKFPVEYMYVGLQPLFNVREATTTGHLVTSGNVNTWRDWHRMTRQLEAHQIDTDRVDTPLVVSSCNKVQPNRYWVPVSTIDTFSLSSHSINIFDVYSDTFFSSYQPFHFGGSNIVTCEDTGALFVNMALFPRTYQPSGHLNISRVRETFIKIASSYCGANTNCTLIVVCKAINFLLISDGVATLRFST